VIVRTIDRHTGEIKHRQMTGRDNDGPWTESPLEMVLALVPDLVEALERNRAAGTPVFVVEWKAEPR
jgi:hypothetical protein